MFRSRALLLVAVTVVSLSIVGPAFGQTESRIGLGVAITHLDHLYGRTAYVPKFIFATDVLTVGAGFSFHTGEDVTNLGAEFDFGINALEIPGGKLAFGAQFDMISDVSGGKEKESLIAFGGFAEVRLDAAQHLTFGLRMYPFQVVSVGDATRFGMFDVGLHATYFF